jgi:hypothetical protein
VLTSTELDKAQALLSQAYLPSTLTSPVRAPSLDVRLNLIKIGRITAGYLRFGDAIRIRTTEATNYHLDIPTAGSSAMRSGSEPPRVRHALHGGRLHARTPRRPGLRS